MKATDGSPSGLPETLAQAAAQVAGLLPPVAARAVVILGSGWSQSCANSTVRAEIRYERLPIIGSCSVDGHPGRLDVVNLAGADFLIFHGRRHFYEGEGWGPVLLPLYVARAVRAPVVLLTNSCGGIRENLSPGDLMAIDDHINAMGVNPLIQGYSAAFGPRFPDMSEVYDEGLRALLDTCAARASVAVRHGVYLATTGPSYETPAEVEAFRMLGADAVGMSTVPEAILARALGLRVAGLSCVANRAAGSGRRLTHADVLAGAQRARPRMEALICAFCETLAHETNKS